MVRFLGRLSLPSKQLTPGKAQDIRAFLQQGEEDQLRLPDGYSTDAAQCSFAEEWGLLCHERTGVFMWPKPLCPTVDDAKDAKNAKLLYCYTGEESFCAAFRSEEPWPRLVDDLATGMRLSATARPPDDFESKEAILINMNPDDSKDNDQDTVSRRQGMADFCIPILAARQTITKVSSGVTGAANPEQGADKKDELPCEDRGLWVVSPRDGPDAGDSIGDLAARLTDADAEVRQGAVIQIGLRVAASNDPTNVELLLGCLEDENADVRRSAVEVLTGLVEKGHDRTLEGIADIFESVNLKDGGNPAVTVHDDTPPLLSVPQVPSDIEQVDLEPAPDVRRNNPNDYVPLSCSCVMTTGTLTVLALVDLILLILTGIEVTNRIHQRNGGFLGKLTDVFMLVTFILSAIGCSSGARVIHELIAHCRTQADVAWIRKTFYVRCAIEMPTFLAVVFFIAYLTM
mmetsp:Transcript_94454/g.182162  ORF Transcript_94454/g.182162 Transcript_94454/m.182162 type:complete len:458 (+) Transcript_94454:58-1431(+)